jgi:hypothetical protein
VRPGGIDRLQVPPNKCCGRLTNYAGSKTYRCTGPCGRRYNQHGKAIGPSMGGVDIDNIHFKRRCVKPGVKPQPTKRATAATLTAAVLQGCVLLPEGSQGGIWFRIGYEQNRSMSLQWDSTPRDPTWKCPLEQPIPASGVPTWMKC